MPTDDSISLRQSGRSQAASQPSGEVANHEDRAAVVEPAAGSAPAGTDAEGLSQRHRPARRRRPVASSSFARSLLGFLFSMVVHLLIVIGLALWIMPQIVETSMVPLTVEPMAESLAELETVYLDQQDDVATEMSFAVGGGSPITGVEESGSDELSKIELDDSLLEDATDASIELDGMLADIARRGELIDELPEGTLGKGRSVVEGYHDAIDRLTREIMLMLYKSKVLVIWCFDASQSMKDDQREIRDRIERIYSELGLSDRASGDALTSAVTSYGKSFQVHTKAPTSDFREVRAAINRVPTDRSGKELMCQAIGRSIAMHRDYATRGRRRMALILVTDESGDREDNNRYLEATIAEAKAARCKIYVLGREAMFGYPYAYFRWKHPETGRPHLLQVDRGPETAFVEQLQTNGFRRREDAHPSGFGPYEQSRMARETGGIFFMLPSPESDLVGGEQRRYELEFMRPYAPDLRSRKDILLDRDRHQLRSMLWKIIIDLNPYDANSGKVVEVSDRFSANRGEFVREVRENQAKAKVLVNYLDEAAKELEKKKFLRERETELRWKANYDLLFAQLIAYKARLYEYGAYLDEFVKNPKEAPMRKSPDLVLDHWHLQPRKETLTGKLTEPDIKRAKQLFAQVIKDHPGTPWAARAEKELGRNFGVKLEPRYRSVSKKPVRETVPLPKL